MILSKVKRDTVDLDKLIESKILSERFNEFQIIVPTNRKLRSLKKELISKAPRKSASQLNVETLSTISKKILAVTKPFIDLSEATSTVLIKQSSEEVNFKYFSIYKRKLPFGTLDRIKNVISEYKKNGVTPEVLLKEAAKLEESSKLKAIDIANIYSVYRSKCFELNALEIGDVYYELFKMGGKQFGENYSLIFNDINLIVITGFDKFSYLEVELLNFLSGIKGVELFIDLDYYYKNKELFSHFDEAYRSFKLKKFDIKKDISPFYTGKYKTKAMKYLFDSNKQLKPESAEVPIKLIKGSSKEDEIEKVAKEIKYLLIHNNVEPHKICVVFNLVSNYSSIVRDKFESFGIPTNLTDRIPLDQSAPVTLIVNVLEILQNEFYYKSIFRAFTNSLVAHFDLDLNNLLETAKSLKIVAGWNNWILGIDNAKAALQFDDFAGEESLSVKLEDLETAKKDLEKIYKLLEPFDKLLSIPEFLTGLKNLVYKLKIFDTILSDNNENSESTIKALTTFFETLDEMFELLSEEYGKDKKFDLKFFLENIRTAAGWARFNIKERSNFGVLVTSADEIRGLKFDYVFVCGLNDGDFPTKYSPEIFYSGSFVKSNRMHQLEERYRFYQTVTSMKKGLYFSYALQDETKDLVPSSFIKDFSKLFTIEEINDEDFQNLIYSDEELLSYFGKNFDKVEFDNILQLRNFNSEIIKNKIKISEQRSAEPFGPYPYNGILDAESKDFVKDFLLSHTNQQFSITQLETYAKCPFKYFLTRILNLKEISEPTEDIDALELGSFLHNVLFKFYTEMRRKNLILQRASEEEFRKIKSLLFNIAKETYDSMNFDNDVTFLEKEKIFGINGNEKESILYKFIQTERELPESFIPKYFEVGFGRIKKRDSDQQLSSFEPLKIGEIKLRGKIDRIDINEEEKFFKIIDYKSGGKKPSIDDLKEGISLQLPVYQFAAKNLLSKKVRHSYLPLEMIIYSLKYNRNDFGPKRINLGGRSKKTALEIVQINENQISETLKMIEEYVYGIKSGKFNLSTLDDREKKVCNYCQFYSICRIRELQV